MEKSNVFKILKSAINNVIDRHSSDKPGLMLFVDDFTLSAISQLISHSEAVNKGIFLFKNTSISNFELNLSSATHLPALFILRPSESQIQTLRSLLRFGKFSEAHFYFTKNPTKRHLTALAEIDFKEIIQTVDYLPLSSILVDRNIFKSFSCKSIEDKKGNVKESSKSNFADFEAIDSIINLFGMFTEQIEIRYDASSSESAEIAEFLTEKLTKNEQNCSNKNLVLLLDRKSDPLSPLMIEWSYRSLVNELLNSQTPFENSNNTTVDQNSNFSFEEFNSALNQIDVFHDKFYTEHKSDSFGVIGRKVQQLAEEVASQSKMEDFETIEDLKHYVSSAPLLAKKTDSAKLHVKILSKLNSEVEKRMLLDVSTFEQEIVCSSQITSGKAIERLKELIQNGGYCEKDLLRISLLIISRFGNKENTVESIRNLFKRHEFSSVDIITKFAKKFKIYSKTLPIDLFSKNFLQKSLNALHSAFKGVENIFSQHKPILAEILSQISSGKLSDKLFPPSIKTKNFQNENNQLKKKYRKIIIFFSGGFTLKEAEFVDSFAKDKPFDIIMGGSCLLNSQKFIDQYAN